MEKTQIDFGPPNSPGKGLADYSDEWPIDLARSIVALSKKEKIALLKYLNSKLNIQVGESFYKDLENDSKA